MGQPGRRRNAQRKRSERKQRRRADRAQPGAAAAKTFVDPGVPPASPAPATPQPAVSPPARDPAAPPDPAVGRTAVSLPLARSLVAGLPLLPDRDLEPAVSFQELSPKRSTAASPSAGVVVVADDVDISRYVPGPAPCGGSQPPVAAGGQAASAGPLRRPYAFVFWRAAYDFVFRPRFAPVHQISRTGLAALRAVASGFVDTPSECPISGSDSPATDAVAPAGPSATGQADRCVGADGSAVAAGVGRHIRFAFVFLRSVRSWPFGFVFRRRRRRVPASVRPVPLLGNSEGHRFLQNLGALVRPTSAFAFGPWSPPSVRVPSGPGLSSGRLFAAVFSVPASRLRPYALVLDPAPGRSRQAPGGPGDSRAVPSRGAAPPRLRLASSVAPPAVL